MQAKTDEMAVSVGDDMALAAFDLLAGVEASRAAAFRGLHRLAVDHARRSARLSACLFARRHDQRMIGRPVPFHLLDRGLEHCLLDLPPLGVERVESLRQRPRLDWIVGGQQPHAEIGGADTPARVDPRPQQIGGVIAAGRFRDIGDVGQRIRIEGIVPARRLDLLELQ